MSNYLQPSTTFKAPSRKPYLHTFSHLIEGGNEGEGEGREFTFNFFHDAGARRDRNQTTSE